jgi:hypothetical protein
VKYLADQGIKFVVNCGGAVCLEVTLADRLRLPLVVEGLGGAKVAADVGGVLFEVSELELWLAEAGVACCPPLGCRPTLPARTILGGLTDPRLLASAEVDRGASEDSSAMVDTWPLGCGLKRVDGCEEGKTMKHIFALFLAS